MKADNASELELQKAVHLFLSDPSKIFNTKSGKRLQVLSPGRHNLFAGPDFLEIGILLDGFVIVGNAEFHKKSSDWFSHQHDDNSAFDDVILHIVLEDDSLKSSNIELLLLSRSELDNFNIDSQNNCKADIDSIEDLQHFALLRLLRKTSEAQKFLNKLNLEDSLIEYSKLFLEKYYKKRRRPIYKANRFLNLIEALPKSPIFHFLNELMHEKSILVQDTLQTLIKIQIADEGAHLRRELILNSVLPLALCLSDEQSRINLFLWFWSTPSLNQYGHLNRAFPNLSQNFLWQQQGMLEYIKDYGKKQNIVADTLKTYGFSNVLSFYREGKAPFVDFNSEN